MTEDEAREWLDTTLNVPRETSDKIGALVRLIANANLTQNLISASTLDAIWSRHIVDSAQLLRLAPSSGAWLDIGSGAGFPGLVIALLSDRPVTLVESRRLRATFLAEAAYTLGLSNVVVHPLRVEAVTASPFPVISARAVASLDRLFVAAHRLSGPETIWLLPKGQSAASELAVAQQTWQGRFVMQPSVTDPASAIITARRVAPRTPRR